MSFSKRFTEALNAGNVLVDGKSDATASTLVGRDESGTSQFAGVGLTVGLTNAGFLKFGTTTPSSSQAEDESTTPYTGFAYDTTSGNLTHTLAAASTSVGRLRYVGKTNSSANTLTIARSGSDTIDGLTSLTIRNQNEGYLIYTSGSSTHKIIAYFAGSQGLGSHTTPITDPGNGGAIAVTQSGYCPIVTAGSETRTLAAPTFIGQEITLYIKTDGGTAVVTVASAINQTGNNTITMADVRDVIVLRAIESGSSKVWMVVANDGAALSTV